MYLNGLDELDQKILASLTLILVKKSVFPELQ